MTSSRVGVGQARSPCSDGGERALVSDRRLGMHDVAEALERPPQPTPHAGLRNREHLGELAGRQ